VGVALGGGGTRGFSEIGVLRVLEQEKIPIDLVVGTSVGSLIGALYCDTGRVLDAEFTALAIEEEDLFDYKVLSLLTGGFVKGERLEQFLTTRLRHKTIESFPVPFAAVAVNLKTGQPVAFERGSVALAVHASCAIPGVFVPVSFGGATYVDGGVVDPIPADFARKKGADVVIAVAIPKPKPQEVPTGTLDVVYHSALIMQAEIARCRAKDADVVIYPEVEGVSFTGFSSKKRLIEAGEEAARRALPAIRGAIASKAEALKR
jgi:NTE family protein